ncbi:MAG: hypothetical protein DUW69_002430 [Verrucomicrobia bacterium]|jgi:hypothetical protein|nr:MAG: hypothetical protein DUW69_002430 [Verrucomicrobiota bacterium]
MRARNAPAHLPSLLGPREIVVREGAVQFPVVLRGGATGGGDAAAAVEGVGPDVRAVRLGASARQWNAAIPNGGF